MPKPATALFVGTFWNLSKGQARIIFPGSSGPQEVKPPLSRPSIDHGLGNADALPPDAAIPIAKVREAQEEFCRARTGDRPKCIDWLLLDQSV
ncbi:Imm1 family immunity protein [Streptomyces sp. NPDC086023]|uniref:Imm1 family immunity protein n=1 Tax=Streptomyces sp. NPDC086023 TaxID=3365746 RepID=UPI0037CE45B5